jgi:hypothetical protein
MLSCSFELERLSLSSCDCSSSKRSVCCCSMLQVDKSRYRKCDRRITGYICHFKRDTSREPDTFKEVPVSLTLVGFDSSTFDKHFLTFPVWQGSTPKRVRFEPWQAVSHMRELCIRLSNLSRDACTPSKETCSFFMGIGRLLCRRLLRYDVLIFTLIDPGSTRSP